MQVAMAGVNEELVERNLPRLEMGIGVDTGRVVVGNIGSRRRMKYSVVGSHVNLASRIESYTVGGQILVSDSTREAIGTDVISRGDLRISAKGFAEPVRVCDVVGLRREKTSLILEDTQQHPSSLAKPIPCVIQIIDGKHIGSDSHRATITALSPDAATVACDHPIDDYTNVLLTSSDDRLGADASMSGKVVDTTQAGFVQIRFVGLTTEQRSELEEFV
jgi:adenylate cyclase